MDDVKPAGGSGQQSLEHPEPDGNPASGWRANVNGLKSVLAQAHRKASPDPFANPILLAAVELDGYGVTDSVSRGDLEKSIRELTLEAFESRAGRLRAYLGEVDIGANRQTIRRLIARLATGKDGGRRDLAAFQSDIERVFYGFVFTAHPTFNLTDDLQSDLLSLATGVAAGGAPLSAQDQSNLAQRVRMADHRPDQPMTLMREHEKAERALESLHQAAAILLDEIAACIIELYPDGWHRLRPRLISIATWVGYDLDGRSDIGWSTTFERRMASASKAIGRYRARIAAMLPKAEAGSPLAAMIGLIDARLALAERNLEDERALLIGYGQGSDQAPNRDDRGLAALNRRMISGLDERLCDATELSRMIDNAMEVAAGTDLLQPLWTLSCLVGLNGLADARTHVRINAIQLHNAVRKAVGMEFAPDDAAHRLSYLDAISKLIREVRPETIHLGSVAHERATAKRAFANIKLMQRFVDSAEPVRFLIAECETSFTLLTALYFAKMFAVEDIVDISPLFETGVALERGAMMIEDALANEDYRAYLRGRGRLCLQTGFSDAGRYLGQTAASNAIERIRLDLVDLLLRHELCEIEIVIFDTHGESIGRGAHPGGFADRFAYYNTAESRRRFDQAGIRIKQESSFQGGDGYVYFMNVAGAFAVVTRVLEHILEPADGGDDPFYRETSYSNEFFAAVSRFNYDVIDDPCYATLLDLFGQNLTYRSGSRAVKRQFDGRGPIIGLQHPSQIRAIPHNAILQQFGILANTIGGLGFAINRDPERFQELYRVSDRFRRLMAMVEHAFKYTDLTVLRAYIDIFDPTFWLLRADTAKDVAAQEMLTISHYMEEIGVHQKLVKIMRRLMRDHMDLDVALREHRRRTRDEGEQPIVIERQVRRAMHLLHSLRIAVISSLFRRAIHVPDFSDWHDTTHEDAIMHLLHLDVLPTVALLKEVFPLIEESGRAFDFGEQVSYASAATQSYAQEHEQIFDPIAADYALIRRIGAGLSHFVGSHG